VWLGDCEHDAAQRKAWLGGDGVGKSTQINQVSRVLTQRGIPHITFLNPQGTEIDTTTGGMPPSAFASKLQSALASSH
jgi:hypothetical protein